MAIRRATSITEKGVYMKIQVRSLAVALAIAGPLTVAATAQSTAAPINGMSIRAAVPALTTDVRYRANRDYPYASYWGYPTYYYGYPTTSSYYYAYPGYGTYSP
jgi:hypothetical protein